jgi:hypothetical protein
MIVLAGELAMAPCRKVAVFGNDRRAFLGKGIPK